MFLRKKIENGPNAMKFLASGKIVNPSRPPPLPGNGQSRRGGGRTSSILSIEQYHDVSIPSHQALHISNEVRDGKKNVYVATCDLNSLTDIHTEAPNPPRILCLKVISNKKTWEGSSISRR
jgi:hypothetical protein